MSEWRLVTDEQPEQKVASEWRIAPVEPSSRQSQSESFGAAAIKAPFRIGEDVIRGGFNVLKNIPQYIESAKTEIPGAFDTLQQHPGHAAQQALAGISELGQNVFNAPHSLINYAANRLNLVPQNINQKVQMARMPSDTQQMINQTFGKPQYPGEELIRGIPRNALNIIAGGKAASVLNPMNLTAKSIAKDVLKTEKKQIDLHSKEYNKIWNEADKSGFNRVPVDINILNQNLQTISKYKTPKEYKYLDEMIKNPTLENAQRAQSDMGVIARALEEKSRTSALLHEEKSIYNAAKEAEKHIEENMFKNHRGEINQSLQNKYKKVTNSYRENVVPYRYNPHIQAYKNKEMLPKELVNALSRGEFAAKKGHQHRAIGIRNMIKDHPVLSNLGLTGAALLAYHNMMGNKTSNE